MGNGALGSMSVTMLTYPKNLEGSITILGEKGTVRIDGVAVNDIQHWEFDEPKDYDRKLKKPITKQHQFMVLVTHFIITMLLKFYVVTLNLKQMVEKV